MSQITLTTLTMSPEELRAMMIEAVNAAAGQRGLPEEARELERLKRKALLTPEEMEKLYGLNARTMANKRMQGRGPAYIQETTGGPVYYEHAAIQKYLDSCRKKSYD